MSTETAAPVLGIGSEARQKLAGARRLDYGCGPIGPGLRALGIERHQQVQPLARIGVDDREQRGISDVEVSLIKQDLSVVLRIGLLDAVALDCVPALCSEALMLPNAGEDQVSAGQVRARNEDAVSVAAEQSADRSETERIVGCKAEAGVDKVLSAQPLEYVAAVKDVAHPQ